MLKKQRKVVGTKLNNGVLKTIYNLGYGKFAKEKHFIY
jgi:hypothetical protein